jgi:glycosyltransferase involved in cell wall biosynthesis
MKPRFSVVLPVYNQADHVGGLVGDYLRELADFPHPCELLLVVNGCRDDSLAVCCRLAERFPAVRVLHSDRGGWGLAVRLGLGEARGDWLCYTNSARTHAKDLLLVLGHAAAHPGTAVKVRRCARGRWRKLGSLLYNLQCRLLLGLPTWDVNGTPKVFPRAFDRLLHLTRDDDLLDAEFGLVCRREGYPVHELELPAARRHGGQSTTTVRTAVNLYWGAYQLWRGQRKAG